MPPKTKLVVPVFCLKEKDFRDIPINTIKIVTDRKGKRSRIASICPKCKANVSKYISKEDSIKYAKLI